MRTNISPEPALLGFLDQAPLHGYDLHRQITQQLGPVWRLGLSQMYAIVKEYEARGWIQTLPVAQNGRPPRKMLKLTPAGKRAFDAWLKESAHGMREFRVDFFARLYFTRAAGRSALRQFLKQQIRETTGERQALLANQNMSEFGDVVRSFRHKQLDTILEWLNAYSSENLPPARGRKVR